MARLLFALFLIVPMIEIAIFIMLGQTIGLLPTLAGVVITAVMGSFLIRKQGLSLLFDIQRMTAQGQMPAQQIAEGVMLAVAGALLLTPGYFTDAVGFALLVPPVRIYVYAWLKQRVTIVGASSGPSPHNGPQGPEVIDLDPDDWHGK